MSPNAGRMGLPLMRSWRLLEPEHSLVGMRSVCPGKEQIERRFVPPELLHMRSRKPSVLSLSEPQPNWQQSKPGSAAVFRRPKRKPTKRRSSTTLSATRIASLLFRPAALDPTWLNSTVRRLAGVIYEERAFERLPVLGDALEDAGCTEGDILNHCRQAGVHVRGCWCLDLILDKP
jgi:hypothetical protein